MWEHGLRQKNKRTWFKDKRTWEHVFKTEEQKNMILRQENMRTCFKTEEQKNMVLRQENMRTCELGEGSLVWDENMRFGWALPNTRCLRLSVGGTVSEPYHSNYINYQRHQKVLTQPRRYYYISPSSEWTLNSINSYYEKMSHPIFKTA